MSPRIGEHVSPIDTNVQGLIPEKGSAHFYYREISDLSSKKALSFWAKGEGKTFAVMVCAKRLGYVPKVMAFEAGPEWKEYVFPFDKFGLDGSDIFGFAVGASMTPGEFDLTIDNVRLR